MARQYQVWFWKAPYSKNPNGWSSQYFNTLKEAKKEASETVAEEKTIEVYEDGCWVNDHIEQKLVKTLVVA